MRIPGSASWHVKEAADFNGDRKADILWQTDTGLPVVWFTDTFTQTGTALYPNPGPEWHVI